MMAEVQKNGERRTLKLDQNLVASEVEAVKAELKQALDDEAQQLTIDLSNVTMMDSMGISVLIAAHNSLQKKGSKLELINLSDNIRKLLVNMRLNQHFTLS